jgi:5-methyltetrahydropteroyltriglutamate--homocysteine methyltransferase
MQLGALTTTSIGSFPRPNWLAQTDRSRATFRLEGEALREAQDDATLVTLREQQELGLDILTDGEQRREGFIFHQARTWDGIDLVNQAQKDVYRRRNAPRGVPRIIGKISRRGPAMMEDVRFAKAHTTLPVKMALAGPMTVIDSALNEAYADEGELAMDIAAAINAELLDLQAAGCDMFQLDEPAMTRYHEKVMDYGAKALDRCLEGIKVPTIVHLCYGYPGTGATRQHEYKYSGVLPELMKTRISGFTVEFGRSDFDPEELKACGDRIVMFGCIDPGNSPAPSVDSVKRRVAGVLEHLSPRQVWLAPDCGLMTISRALATQKLQVMIAAAKSLRQQL